MKPTTEQLEMTKYMAESGYSGAASFIEELLVENARYEALKRVATHPELGRLFSIAMDEDPELTALFEKAGPDDIPLEQSEIIHDKVCDFAIKFLAEHDHGQVAQPQ